MIKTRDRFGREICVGDVLKVYHFTTALRREKYYMYKQVVGTKLLGGYQGRIPKIEYFKVSHLTLDDDHYYLGMGEGVLSDYEIVQSIDSDYRSRPRIASNLAERGFT